MASVGQAGSGSGDGGYYDDWYYGEYDFAYEDEYYVEDYTYYDDVYYEDVSVEVIDYYYDDVIYDTVWDSPPLVFLPDYDITVVVPYHPATPQEAREVALLYEAAFDRRADVPGLNHWIDAREDGHTLDWVAHQFIQSREFQLSYGDPVTLSSRDFVTLLYDNVLGRAPDAAGFAYWTSELDRGHQSREDVLIGFAVSTENVNQSTYLAGLRSTDGDYWYFA